MKRPLSKLSSCAAYATALALASARFHSLQEGMIGKGALPSVLPYPWIPMLVEYRDNNHGVILQYEVSRIRKALQE